MKKIYNKSITLADGKEISFETGKLARQADGAVVLKTGNTMILATVVGAKEAREGADFLPLTVDYQEKFSSSGRIPGGFNKREARLSNYEILISRMIDRAIRPLFPDDYYSEIQVMISLISSDENILPDSFVGLAVSAALSVSDLNFHGPIAEVRVARIKGEFVINPYRDELKDADLDIIVAGTEKDINMVEGSLGEVSEEDMVEALKLAHTAIKELCKAQNEMTKDLGVVKREHQAFEENEEIREKVDAYFTEKIHAVAIKPTEKQERSEMLSKLWDEYVETLTEEEIELIDLHKRYFSKNKKKTIRNVILNEKVRLDGRKTDEIRDITCDVDYLPSTHGSAVFTRGETQSLTSVTLGNKLDEQRIDGAVITGFDKFILHYNFPTFLCG